MVGSDLDLDWPMPSAPPPGRPPEIPVKRLPWWRRLLAKLALRLRRGRAWMK